MFISLSKTIGRVGGFRLGIGKRITLKNAWWMFLILTFVYLGQLMWYMCVVMFWLMYAMFYGMWWLMKAMVKGIIALFAGGATAASKVIEEKRMADSSIIDARSITSSNKINTIEPANNVQMRPTSADDSQQNSSKNKFCPECGRPITPGNGFCTGCGKPVT